jgi:hypothetical protein
VKAQRGEGTKGRKIKSTKKNKERGRKKHRRRFAYDR